MEAVKNVKGGPNWKQQPRGPGIGIVYDSCSF
jgi:hypothetical protein